MTTPALPGFDTVCDHSRPYGAAQPVFLGNLGRYPAAVAEGVRQALLRFEYAQVPAFPEGRRIWSPLGSVVIQADGRPTRRACAVSDFSTRARAAAERMAADDTYSFNHTFDIHYLQEEHTHA